VKPVDGGADDDQQWYAEAAEKHAAEDQAESVVHGSDDLDDPVTT
jgi:hypothetical protein